MAYSPYILPGLSIKVSSGLFLPTCHSLEARSWLGWSSDTHFIHRVHYLSLFFFGLTMWHTGSQFPSQGSNPCPVQWKRGVLTTVPPEKSQRLITKIKNFCSEKGSWPCKNISHKLGNFFINIHLTSSIWILLNTKMDKQQGPTVQHRELYSISCNKP